MQTNILIFQTMEKELPKIDFPEEWVIGTGISKELLSLYTNFPCRLKAEMFILCMEGEIEASVNLNRISVHAYDFVTIMPGSIFQIHRIEGNLRIYFGGFSSKYIEQTNFSRSSIDTLYVTLGKPVFSKKLLEGEYFKFLMKLYAFFAPHTRNMITPYLYNNIHAGITAMYHNKPEEKNPASKGEQLSKNFTQLVMQNYSKIRNVSWYAEKLGITHAHLCTTVKQTTGSTCVDIIAHMVIMDAKSQLKLTNLSIQAISDSLNFANMSFFGKYFKRYTGMSPLEYRNNG